MEAVTIRILIGLLRHLLYRLSPVVQGVSGWLIHRGIASEEDIAALVTGIVMFVVTAGSFWYQQWREKRQKEQE